MRVPCIEAICEEHMDGVTQESFDAWSADHPEWQRDGENISRTRRCDSFAAAVGFVASVGVLADVADHHPDIDIRYRNVMLTLTTHDAGFLTQKDLDLADAIDGLP